MSITLTFARPHLSITTLPRTQLPAFTLLTGLNGSGKTHLLRAIQNGSIQIDGVPKESIKFFDWTTLGPGPAKAYDSSDLAKERQKAADQLRRAYAEATGPLITIARDAGLPEHLLENPRAIPRLSFQAFTELYDRDLYEADRERPSKVYAKVRDAVRASSSKLEPTLIKLKLLRKVKAIARQAGSPIAALELDTILDAYAWGKVDAFSQDFSRLFVAYRHHLLQNELAQFRAYKGDPDARPLSDAEFIAQYNLPPWEFLNGILGEAGLDFAAEPPDLNDHWGSYQFMLRKKASGAYVDVDGLSSGEKIIMSFTNCLYSARDQRQIATFPKVLLLDEVDAPLHPSMARGLIRMITQSLVEEFKISVIAATHSASTVAMAPEEAVYVMTADAPGIHKVRKDRALAVLTAGVPTLSLSVDGRRQVFVESGSDARVYEAVYQVAKQYLKSEKSLTFLAPGAKGKDGDHYNGCDAVRRIVRQLTDSGNRSVLGLIDWDGKRKSDERLKILAEGKRNGLENCLLDPLLLVCLIAKEAKYYKRDIGLAEDEGPYQLKRMGSDQIQAVVDNVQLILLGADGIDTLPTVRTRYAGEMELSIKKEILVMDDHALESLVLEKFGPLNKFRENGQLVMAVAGDVLLDFHEYLPMDVVDTFSDLLNVEL